MSDLHLQNYIYVLIGVASCTVLSICGCIVKKCRNKPYKPRLSIIIPRIESPSIEIRNNSTIIHDLQGSLPPLHVSNSPCVIKSSPISRDSSYSYPSPRVRTEYINSLIQEYILYSNDNILEGHVRQKFNNFKTAEDIQQIKSCILP